MMTRKRAGFDSFDKRSAPPWQLDLFAKHPRF
jgi:hypothetical protein